MRFIARPLLLSALLFTIGSRAPAADDDPFSDANKAVARAKDDKPRTRETVEDRITFAAAVEPKEQKRGQTVRLTITGTPKPGYHTYPLTQRAPEQDATGLCQLSYEVVPGLRLLSPVVESDPQPANEPGGVWLEHAKPFTWVLDVLILPEATPGDKELPITIKLQACNDKTCLNGTITVKASVRVLDGPAVPLTPDLQKRLDAPLYEIKEVFAPAPPPGVKSPLTGNPPDREQPKERGGPDKAENKDAAAPTPADGKINADSGFFHIIALAGGAAFLMLLTPCVFPMIPITVSFFLKQAENKHLNPVLLATVYALTITVLLSAAVLVLGSLVISLANDPWLNLAMGLLLMFFALSLFGMYEIELPHFLSQFTSAREGQGGYLGVFFMALTFTITSFTCTGPFLGPLLASATTFTQTQLVVAAVAYSGTFAAPFFVLALFPSLLKALPKSGGWLNAIKVVMGFVEVALALKFFSIMDNALFPGDPRLFNYDTVLCAWIVLSAACGLYLLGVFRLPHDTPIDHVGVPRLLFATFFLGLAVYMAPALWRNRLLGTVGENIVAFLPPDSRPEGVAEGGGGKPAEGLAWTRDYQKAWERAKAEGKLLFIDFTGVNCANCRFNEKNVFTRTDVRQELKSFVLVQLYQDYVPNLPRDQSEAEGKRNLAWQDKTFGDISLPLYIVLDPSGTSKPVTDDGKLAGVEKGRDSGAIYNVSAFVNILTKARETKQVAQRP
jgi:thiol:disulfide interchange protein DsbD